MNESWPVIDRNYVLWFVLPFTKDLDKFKLKIWWSVEQFTTNSPEFTGIYHHFPEIKWKLRKIVIKVQKSGGVQLVRNAAKLLLQDSFRLKVAKTATSFLNKKRLKTEKLSQKLGEWEVIMRKVALCTKMRLDIAWQSMK